MFKPQATDMSVAYTVLFVVAYKDLITTSISNGLNDVFAWLFSNLTQSPREFWRAGLSTAFRSLCKLSITYHIIHRLESGFYISIIVFC